MESAWCFRDVILFGRTLLVLRRIFALFVCLVIQGCYVPTSNTYWIGEGTPEFEQDRTICLEELEEHLEALKAQEAGRRHGKKNGSLFTDFWVDGLALTQHQRNVW